MPETNQKTDKQIIEELKQEVDSTKDYWKERESRIIGNNEESMKNREKLFNRRLTRMENELHKVLPNTDTLSKLDMFYYKRANLMGDKKFAVGKKETLKIDKYQLGVQIYPLPDEFKIELQCILLAFFDVKHKLLHYGIINRQFKNTATYHSTAGEICLNENRKPYEVVDFKNPETIIEGFKEVLSTLETINPASYLVTSRSEFPKKLRATYNFVNQKHAEFHARRSRRTPAGRNDNWRWNDDGTCAFCDMNSDGCDCDVCGECRTHMDGCQCNFCDLCDRRRESGHYDECLCHYCSDCENYYTVDDICDCEFCDSCHDRLESNHYDVCGCSNN